MLPGTGRAIIVHLEPVDCVDWLRFLARLHEVHRAIVVTSVVPVYVYVYIYVYVRVTLSVKVFKIVIS